MDIIWSSIQKLPGKLTSSAVFQKGARDVINVQLPNDMLTLHAGAPIVPTSLERKSKLQLERSMRHSEGYASLEHLQSPRGLEDEREVPNV